MIKTFVSIEVDLPSSLAMRFVCQLGGSVNMEIQPAYVKESPSRQSAMGAGWARRTWEKEMIQQGKEEISELIGAEMDSCSVLREPRVVYGDRESELFKLTHTEEFDLYVEGVHFSWTPHDICKRLHSRFYQNLPSPFILVRSPRKVNQVMLLCLDGVGTQTLDKLFQRIWENCPVPLRLYCPPARDEFRDAVDQARQHLERSGCTVSVHDTLTGAPGQSDAQTVQDYGLVAIALDRGVKKDDPELHWLDLVKTSSLLVFH